MTKRLQHQDSVSGMRRRAADLLRLAIVFVPLLMTRSVQAQTYTILYSFLGTDGQAAPWGPLTLVNGNLYGTTQEYPAVFSVDAKTGKNTLLYNFKALPDGQIPYSGVIRDAVGNLYGTTSKGGTSNRGTIFKVDSAGNETILHSFSKAALYPYGGLTRGANGSLYGTTTFGGTFHQGIVFRLDKNGHYTILYNFKGGTDGAAPGDENLLLDGAGNLYGTTNSGGSRGTDCNSTCGTVFKLDIKTRGETVLYRFTGGADGAYPYAGLVRDANGNFYGTTSIGGGSTGCAGGSCGTVFKLDANGIETVLHSFQGTDGANPYGGLILDAQGNLYGTTLGGGTYLAGTVFKLDPNGVETVLHNFNGSDGKHPTSSLVQDAKGNLYGTTFEGGTAGFGVVFKIAP